MHNKAIYQCQQAYAYLSHLLDALPKKDCNIEALMPWCFIKD